MIIRAGSRHQDLILTNQDFMYTEIVRPQRLYLQHTVFRSLSRCMHCCAHAAERPQRLFYLHTRYSSFQVFVFVTLHALCVRECSFYPSTSSTTSSVRADSSILEEIQVLCACSGMQRNYFNKKLKKQVNCCEFHRSVDTQLRNNMRDSRSCVTGHHS